MAGQAQALPKDPIQTRSMSVPIFIASAALVGSMILALYDEFVWRRPYKDYQEAFVVVYANFLEHGLLPRQKERLKAIEELPEYVELAKAIQAEEAKVAEVNARVDKDLVPVITNIDRIADTVKVARAKYQALNYLFEKGRHIDLKEVEENGGKMPGTDALTPAQEKVKKDMDEVLAGPYVVTVLDASGNDVQLSLNYDQLNAKMAEFRDQKAAGENAKGAALKLLKELQARQTKIVETNLVGPHPDSVKKLMAASDDRKIGASKEPMGLRIGALPNGQVLQINIDTLNWVDRCESCHVGTREPIEMTKEDLAAIEENNITAEKAVVFSSHPSKALLDVHDPERFGCSMCHGGNGRSVSKVELAHGLNKHWTAPLHPPENYEAGCVQCHREDLVLKSRGVEAKTLNEGKWLFYWKGCWGCHKYEGFDREPDHITVLEKERAAMAKDREKMLRDREGEEMKAKDKAMIDQKVATLDTKMGEINREITSLHASTAKVGPSLRDIRHKVKRDWLPGWIENPKVFKPSTKMPVFRYEPGDVSKIAAYLWQNYDEKAPQKHQPGDITKGQWQFEQRGCLACHQVQRDGKMFGDGFATELTRIGDKAEFDAVVDWILNPTNGVMPNLRLTVEEARDLTTYLFSLGTKAPYPAAPELEDPKLAAEGAAIIRHFGCAGCHEIKGMETESRIGTELTYEGSKPKERLDFGRLEHDFKKEKRYTHKDFFETKLTDPARFGLGKNYKDPREKLKMPNFHLAPHEVNSLTTFLMGSTEHELPTIEKNTFEEAFAYNPDEQGQAIREGWWVVKKYNCVGCHQFETGDQPHLWTMPMYVGKSPDGKGDLEVRRPPSLVGQGFRTDPIWLAKFLRNPALTNDAAVAHRNGVRTYLDVRMPTFRLSDLEIQKIVRFFGALSAQPAQYQKEDLAPLSAQENTIARALVKSIRCINCHAIGEPKWDAEKANAPRLTIMGERMNPPWTRRWIQNPKLLMPGTVMPQNFSEQWEVQFKNGTVYRGIGYEESGTEGKIKQAGAAEPTKFNLADLKAPAKKTGHWIANDVPPEALGYEGDHIDLITRYLHLNYNNQTEIDATLPPN